MTSVQATSSGQSPPKIDARSAYANAELGRLLEAEQLLLAPA